MELLHHLQNSAFFIGSFIVVLSVIVFVHEFGHYYVAKLGGVKIETFSIGFGKEIFGWNDKHGTRWKVSWLPLGGYVKMFGDMGAASTPDIEKLKKMDKSAKQCAFPFKPLWLKAAIVAAGPLTNFVFAIIILTGLYMVHGKTVSSAEIANVAEGSAAAEAGLLPGDVITSINGNRVASFSDIQRNVAIGTGKPFRIIFMRDDVEMRIDVTPQMIETKDNFGNDITMPRLGIASGKADYQRFGLFGAFIEANVDTYVITASTLKVIGQMIIGDRTPRDISGPIGIAKYSGQAAERGFSVLLWFMAAISINLGLINLFPIPLLDGGHLLYYAIEAIKGKPVAEKWQNFGFRLGFGIVIAFAAFAIINDIVKLVH